MAINIDDNKAFIDRFDCSEGGSIEEEIRHLYDITAELTDDFRKTFIVVQTMTELQALPKEDLVNGRVIKVVDSNGTGKPAYYSFNYGTQTFERITFASDPRAFITVDTANDLIMLPASELVHGKLVRVNRPKSSDSDSIPDIVQDPVDYYKPAYYSYDSIGNQWVLTEFGGSGGGSGVTEEYVAEAIANHNTSESSHQDIRSTLNTTMITVDTVEDMNSIPKSNLVNGRVIRVSHDESGKAKYYSWDSENSKFVEENFGIGTIDIDDVVGLSDVLSWKNIS